MTSRSGVELIFNPDAPVTKHPSPSSKHQAPATLTRPCDPRLIESAISNLIQNAIRHSGSKTVEISIEPTPEGKALIHVTDHGVGIPKDCRQRLFERFYRVDKNRSRTLGGTGLGLAIVKHIAQLHGGEVAVRSTPGKETVFSLTI